MTSIYQARKYEAEISEKRDMPSGSHLNKITPNTIANCLFCASLVLFFSGDVAAVIFPKQEPVLPLHSQPSDGGMAVAFAMIAIYVIEKILTSSVVKRAVKYIASKLPVDENSPLHAAYVSAQRSFTKKTAEAKTYKTKYKKPQPEPDFIVDPPLEGSNPKNFDVPRLKVPVFTKCDSDEPSDEESSQESEEGVVDIIVSHCKKKVRERVREFLNPPEEEDEQSISIASVVSEWPEVEYARTLPLPIKPQRRFFEFYALSVAARLIFLAICWRFCHISFSLRFIAVFLMVPVGHPTFDAYCPLYPMMVSGIQGTPVLKGQRKAAEADDETVMTTSDASDLSSIEELKIKYITLSPTPTTSTRKFESLISMLGDTSTTRVVVTFLTSVLTAPAYANNKTLCVIHHANAFQNLFVGLKAVHGTARISEALATFSATVTESLGFVAQSGDIEPSSWMETFAEGFEKLSKFGDSPVGSVLSAGLALITSLPILASKCYSATTMSEQWKLLKTAFSQTGASISTILRNMVALQRTVMAVEATPSPSGLLSLLTTSAPLQAEYAECRAIWRRIALGHASMTSLEANEFLLRLKRLEHKLLALIKSKDKNCTPMDLTMAKEATELLYSYHAHHVKSCSRIVPYVYSMDGLPAVGKSTFNNTVMKLLHEWNGYADIMSFATVILGGKTDEVCSNSTTGIVVDDAGNPKGNMRNKENCYSAFLFIMVQPTYREIRKADLPDKGKHFYDNKFLACLDNHPEGGISEEIHCPQAGLRRKGDSAEVRVRPEFATRSGALDLTKAGHFTYGEAHLFRPYVWEKDGNAPSRQVNFFEGDGWVDNLTYLRWLKERSASHFKQQKERLAREQAQAQEILCTTCNLLPYRFCGCLGEDKNFMDAQEAEAFTDAFRNPAARVVSMVDYLGIQARFALCSNSRAAWVFFYVFDSKFLEKAFVFSVIVACCLPDEFLTITTSFAFLIGFFCLCKRIIKSALEKFRFHTLPELVDAHVASVGSYLPTLGLALVAASTLLAVPSLLKMIVGALPVKHCAEALVVEDEKAPLEQSNKEEKPPPPIWAPIKRIAFETSQEAVTIVTEDLLELVKANIVPVKLHFDGSTTCTHIFMLNSKMGVAVGHAFLRKGKVHAPKVSFGDSRPFRLYLSQMYIPFEKDLVYLYMDGRFGCKKDLSKYLPENTIPKGFFHKLAKTPLGDWVTEKAAVSLEKNALYALPDSAEVCMKAQELYAFRGTSLATAEGQCGLPYVSDGKKSVIPGIHVAGNKHLMGSSIVPLLKSDYQEACKMFALCGFELPLIPIKHELKVGSMAAECEISPKHPVNFMPDDGRELILLYPTQHNFTPRSALKENPFIENAMKHLKARYLKRKPIMKLRQSCRKVLERCTRTRVETNYDLLLEAQGLFKRSVTNKLCEGVEWEEHQRRPLSYAEVLNGIPGKVVSITLSTSSGIGGKKRDYITGPDGSREFLPAFQAECDEILRKVRAGFNPLLPATACLKDEPRPPEKEVQRLFYNPTFHQYVLMARYLRCILDFIAANGAAFFTAIGYDPVGESWQQIVEPFAREEFAHNCFDLDYEAFDASQSSALRNMACLTFVDIARYMWDSPEDVRDLRALLSWANSTPVDFLGAVMMIEALLLSGTIFTAHGNGLITSLIVCADYLRFWRSKGMAPPRLKDHISLVTLGDDTVGAVSNMMRGAGWNQEHLVETARSFGLVLTTASKDTDFRFKSFTECEFLKRHYYYNKELELNVAVLSPTSYLQPFVVYSQPKDLTLDEYQSDQAEIVLLECMAGGRLAFEEMQRRLTDYYEATPNLGKPECLLWSYDEKILERKKFLTPQPQLFPCGETGLELISKYDSLPPTAMEMRAESSVEEAVIQSLEGNVQEESGYVNVHADISRMPVIAKTEQAEVLSRRQLLKSLSLPLTGNEIFWPEADMVDQPIFLTRASNMAFRATAIKLTFVLTCPSTVTGCFMAAVHYHLSPTRATELNGQDSSFLLCSQLPHVMMRPGEQSNIWHLTVPFVFHMPARLAHDVYPPTMPAVSIIPVVPLTGSLGAAPQLTLKVYGEFVGMELYGATSVVNPANLFSAESLTEEEEDVSSTTVCAPIECPPIPRKRTKRGPTVNEMLYHAYVCPGCVDSSCVSFKALSEHFSTCTSAACYNCDMHWQMIIAHADGCTTDCPLVGCKAAKRILRNIDDYTKKHTLPYVYAYAVKKGKFPDGYCYLGGLPVENRGEAIFELGCFVSGKTLTEFILKEGPEDKTFRCTLEIKGGQAHVVQNKYSAFTLLDHARRFPDITFGGEDLPKEKISTRILKVANLAERVLSTPGVSMTPLANLNTPVEMLKTVGSTLQKFGFSKPVSNEVSRPSAFFPNGEGTDYADVLAPDPLCEVSPGLPSTTDDEMTFAHLSRKWNLVSRFTIPSDAMPGTDLFTCNVTPSIMVGGRPATCCMPSLVTQLWRGSMEYKFVLYCPLLVATRMIIFWDPLGQFHTDRLGNAPMPAEDFLEHVVLDSSTIQETEIVVGYSSNQPCLGTYTGKLGFGSAAMSNHWSSPASYLDRDHNGSIRVQLLDMVASSAPVVVHCLVYARAGEDMQWGRYTGKLTPGLNLPVVTYSDPLVLDEVGCAVVPLISSSTCEVSPGVPTPTLSTTQAPAATTAPAPVAKPSSAPTVAPTGKPTSLPTQAPTTQKPTAAATAPPSTAQPTTISPTTAAPTTGKPTALPTNNPTTGKPTAAPAPPPTSAPTTPAPTDVCATGRTLLDFPGIGTGIQANITVFGGQYPYVVAVQGGSTSLNTKDLMTFAYCSRIFFTLSRNTNHVGYWEILQNGTVLSRFTNTISRTVGTEYYYDVALDISPVTYPDVVNLQIRSDSTTETLNVRFAGSAGIPNDYVWSYWTPADPASLSAYFSGPSGTGAFGPYNDVTQRTATKVVKNGVVGYWDSEYFIFSPVFSPDIPNATTRESRFIIQVYCRGSISCPEANWSVSKNADMVRMLMITGSGWFRLRVDGPNDSNNYISRVAILSKMPTTAPASVNRAWSGSQTRRLRDVVTDYLPFSNHSAEAEIVEEASVVPKKHHLGAPLDFSEFFVRMCVGEQLLSFRTLLKVPSPSVTFIPSVVGESAHISGAALPYSAGEEGNSLFNFLYRCYLCWRGGMMSHYVLMGDCTLEVSRVTSPSQPTSTAAGGVSFTNSRVNPRLSVKFPWQESALFKYSFLEEDMSGAKVVKIFKHDASPVLVREYKSTAEDFSFHYFNGTPVFT